MKLWEAMKALDEGKKVRNKDWSCKEFIYKNELGEIVWEDGEKFQMLLDSYTIKYGWDICNEK